MSSSQEKQRARYDFERALEELDDVRGQGTELVSLYIPPDKRLHDVVQKIREEQGEAQNIKSKSTRKNVTSALDSIESQLRQFDEVPENGLVLFVGHAGDHGSDTEMVQHVLEPPRPLQTFTYRCDSSFYLDPLSDLLKEEDVYGLVCVDRSSGAVGFLRGTRIETVWEKESNVPSKHSKGGQSAQRFERLIEEAADNFFKMVAKQANRVFQDEEDLKGILVGGPGATKDDFVDRDLLHHELQDEIVDTFDTGYADASGLRELVQKAQDTLRRMGVMEEKELMQEFLSEVKNRDAGLSAYGEDHVRQALKMGAVDTLLLSKKLRSRRLTLECPECGHEDHETREDAADVEEDPPICDECGAEAEVTGAEDLVEELSREAEDKGTEVELIGAESEEGELLWNAFGGIAAILRFELNLSRENLG